MEDRRTRRLVNIILGVLTLAILGPVIGYGSGLFGTDPTYVQTEFVEKRTLTHVVEAFGRVHPNTWVTIRPDVSGEVFALPVDEGSTVQEGDLLAQIRTDDYEDQIDKISAEIQQRRADVTRHRVDSTQARHQYERQKQLYESGVSSKKRLEKAHHTLEQAATQLSAARARLAEADARLRETRGKKRQATVRAPMDGVVSRLDVQKGEQVVGTGLFPGTHMMRLEQMGQPELRLNIDESNIVDVATGDTASIQLSAYQDHKFSGTVISTMISRRSATEKTMSSPFSEVISGPLFELGAGYPTRLDIRSPSSKTPSEKLKTGMGGTARIRTEKVENALSVSRDAITYRYRPGSSQSDSTKASSARNPRKVVFVVRNGTAKRIDVETGLRTDSYVHVHSGLRLGDEVIVGPEDAVQQRLSDGTVVEAGPTPPSE